MMLFKITITTQILSLILIHQRAIRVNCKKKNMDVRTT